MSSVRAERLAFSYSDAVPLLSGVDFHLEAGFTGVVGENGAGKSTLLRLLAGELAPSSGRILLEPRCPLIVRCPQEVAEPGSQVLALAAAEDAASRRMVARLRLGPCEVARWETLSPGERRRWQLGAALAREPDLLLLDEPTNHVDAEARALLVAALRRFRGVGIVVSHDRELLEALTARTLRVRGGGVQLFPGPYGAARSAWALADAAAMEARTAAQAAARRAARVLDTARRVHAKADAGRSAGRRMKGPRDHDARSMGAGTVAGWAEQGLGRKVRTLRREAERAAACVPGSPPLVELGRSVFVGFERSPRPWLLELDAAQLDAGGLPLLRGVRVRLGRADRVHLRGGNGAGKTTLLRALLAASGSPPERILYLPQELAAGEAAATLGVVKELPPDERGRVLSVAAALGVDPDRLLASVEPSPGEARKLRMALGLGRHAFGLVLDEPTNHLDLPSIERLEAALVAYPGAILLVTHDEGFAARCTSTAWEIVEGRVRT